MCPAGGWTGPLLVEVEVLRGLLLEPEPVVLRRLLEEVRRALELVVRLGVRRHHVAVRLGGAAARGGLLLATQRLEVVERVRLRRLVALARRRGVPVLLAPVAGRHGAGSRAAARGGVVEQP